MTQSTQWGERIRRFREAAGLTLEELAVKAGIRTMTLSSVENGGNTMTNTLVAIAKALDLPLAVLMREGGAGQYTEAEARVVADRMIWHLKSSEPFRQAMREAVLAVNRELAQRQSEREPKKESDEGT